MKALTRSVFFATLLILVSCSNDADIKKAQEDKETQRQAMKAIQDCLDKSYPGWMNVGMDISPETLNTSISVAEVEPVPPIQIHLTKDQQDKVVTVVLKKFFSADGEVVWHAFRPTSIQLGAIELGTAKKKAVTDADEKRSDDDNDYGEPDVP